MNWCTRNWKLIFHKLKLYPAERLKYFLQMRRNHVKSYARLQVDIPFATFIVLIHITTALITTLVGRGDIILSSRLPAGLRARVSDRRTGYELGITAKRICATRGSKFLTLVGFRKKRLSTKTDHWCFQNHLIKLILENFYLFFKR